MGRSLIRAKFKKFSIGFLKLKKVYKYIFHLKIYIHGGPSESNVCFTGGHVKKTN